MKTFSHSDNCRWTGTICCTIVLVGTRQFTCIVCVNFKEWAEYVEDTNELKHKLETIELGRCICDAEFLERSTDFYVNKLQHCFYCSSIRIEIQRRGTCQLIKVRNNAKCLTRRDLSR